MKILRAYAEAAKAASRFLPVLIVEALALRLSRTGLGLSEYIDFQLYKNDLTWADKKAFGGIRAQAALEEILVDDYARFISLDKLTMYALLEAYKLPIPKVKAVYRSSRPAAVTCLHTAIELGAFLRRPDTLPVYVKRAFGAYGRGNIVIVGLRGDNLLFSDGSSQSIAEFSASLDGGRGLGWLLQEPLTPHERIAELTNVHKISGLRVHTFLDGEDVRIVKAVFKMNAGLKDSDNFEHGASGNFLAGIDLATGRLTRVISGTGLEQTLVSEHPQTWRPLVGFEIPYWSEVVGLLHDAGRAFPGYLCPGWDIAICPDGPKILEVNFFGDLDLPQHANRQGFLDSEFMNCLARRNLDRLLGPYARLPVKSSANGRRGLRRRHWLW